MHPSEILEGLRNDGRSRHHRMVLAVKIVILEAKLLELKKLVATSSQQPAQQR